MIGARRRILSNSALSLAGSMAARAANALLLVLLARQGADGPQLAGAFSLGTTYLAVFSALLWGLDELAVREVARAPEETGRYFSHLVVLRLLLGLLAVGALRVAVAAAGYGADTAAFLVLLGWSVVADGLSAACAALFTAHRRFGAPFLAGIAVLVLKVGGGAWALYAGWGLTGIALTWVAGSCAGAVLYLAATLVLLRPPPVGLLPLARGWWARVLRLSVPFMVISTITILDWQADVLLLSLYRGVRDVGWYSAALTIFLTLWLLPQAYRVALFPEMARLQASAPGELERLYERSMRWLLAMALPIAAGLSLLAGGVVQLLYKSDFEPSVPVLQVLAWVLVPLFLNVPGVRLLMVKERQGLLAWFVAASLAVNVAANLLLIPAWGILGATAARALSAGLFFVLHYVALRRVLPGFRLRRIAWRPALATAGMAAGVWLVRSAPLGVAVATGVALYAVLGWWLVMEPGERQAVAARVRPWRVPGRRASGS